MAVILCIDDCESGLFTRKLVLETHGYQVLTATSAEAGLEVFLQSSVDLVISDHCLKGKSGAEIADEMKSSKPEVPFLLLSGHPEPPSDLRSVDKFVSKGG